MQGVIIADTCCLILLDKIGQLELLRKLFGMITITQEIQQEYKKQLPDWFKILSPQNKTYQKIIQASLDTGEASAIALALEIPESLIVIDDLKGRRLAEQLGIMITGTLGILVDAKLSGHLESVKLILEKIKTTNFRITEDLENNVLRKVGEL